MPQCYHQVVQLITNGAHPGSELVRILGILHYRKLLGNSVILFDNTERTSWNISDISVSCLSHCLTLATASLNLSGRELLQA